MAGGEAKTVTKAWEPVRKILLDAGKRVTYGLWTKVPLALSRK